MFKRLVFLVLLALPGAFLVLTVVSNHPRYRGQIAVFKTCMTSSGSANGAKDCIRLRGSSV